MKKLIIILSIFAALVVVSGSVYIYSAYNPNVSIARSVAHNSTRSDDEFHSEIIMSSISEFLGIPTAKSVNDNIMELGEWNNTVLTELSTNYMQNSPYDVRVSGEVKNGKTILRYEGSVTTQDGETIDYKNEKVFDFTLCTNEELFN